MPNLLIISPLNPIWFIPQTPVVYPQYNTKQWDDYNLDDRLYQWQEKIGYSQKWQTSDVIKLQFQSNFDPIQIDLKNDYGYTPLTVSANQVRANKYMPGWYVYEATLSLTSVPVGCYTLYCTPAGSTTQIQMSCNLDIQVNHPGTVLFEYKHSKFKADVVFETGIEFMIRVEGARGKLNPVSEDYMYRNQKLSPSLLSSKPYRIWDLSLGGSYGFPDWMVDKINWMWSCDSVRMDGRSYTKNADSSGSGSAITLKEEDNYPMYAMDMQIQEGNNRGSKLVSPEVDPSMQLLVAYQIDSNLFGDEGTQASSNLVPILSVE